MSFVGTAAIDEKLFVPLRIVLDDSPNTEPNVEVVGESKQSSLNLSGRVGFLNGVFDE